MSKQAAKASSQAKRASKQVKQTRKQASKTRVYCHYNLNFFQVLTREEETVKKQLVAVSQSLSESCVESLVVIWRGICERLFSHYRTAVNAYFKYLRLHGKVMQTMMQFTEDTILFPALAFYCVLLLLIGH